MPTRRSRVFFTVFSALLAAGLTAMGLHAALRAGELAERQTARLSQDLHDSYQECSTMTTAAVRTAVTFHTEALVLALDEQGSVLARTQEFLLLRDISNRNPPYLALLPGLTGAQRSALWRPGPMAAIPMAAWSIPTPAPSIRTRRPADSPSACRCKAPAATTNAICCWPRWTMTARHGANGCPTCAPARHCRTRAG